MRAAGEGRVYKVSRLLSATETNDFERTDGSIIVTASMTLDKTCLAQEW